jgi:hypothetical protein
VPEVHVLLATPLVRAFSHRSRLGLSVDSAFRPWSLRPLERQRGDVLPQLGSDCLKERDLAVEGPPHRHEKSCSRHRASPRRQARRSFPRESGRVRQRAVKPTRAIHFGGQFLRRAPSVVSTCAYSAPATLDVALQSDRCRITSA